MKPRAWRRLIRGQWWIIRLAPASDIQAHASPGESLLGVTLYATREILILDSLRGPLLLEIVAHEWEHAEHPAHDHRVVHRRSRQLARILADCLDGGHSVRTRGSRGRKT